MPDCYTGPRTLEELKEAVARAQEASKTVVFTNGCFDLIHVGHIRYLRQARQQGDILIVAINGDASVRALKGPGRPLQSEQDRAEIIGSMEFVDHVTIFDGLTVDELLRTLKPDVHAKGTDYTAESVPESASVRSYGGRVAIVGDPKDHSSRDLIARILVKGRSSG